MLGFVLVECFFVLMLSFWNVLRDRIAPSGLEGTAVGRAFCGFSLTKCSPFLEILLFSAFYTINRCGDSYVIAVLQAPKRVSFSVYQIAVIYCCHSNSCQKR